VEITDPRTGLVLDPAHLAPTQRARLFNALRARNRELEAQINRASCGTRVAGGAARERARRLRQIAAGQLEVSR
jgi:hypothetical protein